MFGLIRSIWLLAEGGHRPHLEVLPKVPTIHILMQLGPNSIALKIRSKNRSKTRLSILERVFDRFFDRFFKLLNWGPELRSLLKTSTRVFYKISLHRC